jgi:energy-coupling factor transport system permease protein
MECRCYHGGEGRTRLKVLKYRSSDIVTVFLGIALCVGIGFMGHYGL